MVIRLGQLAHLVHVTELELDALKTRLSRLDIDTLSFSQCKLAQ